MTTAFALGALVFALWCLGSIRDSLLRIEERLRRWDERLGDHGALDRLEQSLASIRSDVDALRVIAKRATQDPLMQALEDDSQRRP